MNSSFKIGEKVKLLESLFSGHFTDDGVEWEVWAHEGDIGVVVESDDKGFGVEFPTCTYSRYYGDEWEGSVRKLHDGEDGRLLKEGDTVETMDEAMTLGIVIDVKDDDSVRVRKPDGAVESYRGDEWWSDPWKSSPSRWLRRLSPPPADRDQFPASGMKIWRPE